MFREMKGVSAGIRILMALTGLCMVILGSVLFFNARAIIWIFMVTLTFRGLGLVIKYFAAKEKSGWDLLNGALYLIFGIWMITGDIGTRTVALISMEYMLGIWVAVSGITHIIGSLSIKSDGDKTWGWLLAGGIMSLIIGIVMFSHPFIFAVFTIELMSVFAGAALVIQGLTGLALALSGGGKPKAA